MAGNCGSSTTTVASVMPQGCSSKRPPIISPNSGQEKKAVIAEWAATKPFPSSLTKESRSARCSGGEVDLANAEEEDGVEVVEVAGLERLALWRSRRRHRSRSGRLVMGCESVRMNVS